MACLYEFCFGESENKEKDEKMVVEMNKNELFSFFKKLEKIQNQLDSLA
jgi:hypothetical protein